MARDDQVAMVELFLECLVTNEIDRMPIGDDLTVESPLTPRLCGSDALEYVKAVAAAAKSITVLEHIVEGEEVATLLEEEVDAGLLRVFSRFHLEADRITDVRVFYDPRLLTGPTRDRTIQEPPATPETSVGGGAVSTPTGHLSGAPQLTQYARLRRAGDLLFVAGISSRQPDDSIKGASRDGAGALAIDIRAQTEGCIENLRLALASADLQLQDLVDVTVFLANMADYGGFNESWNRYFDQSGPTRTTVAVSQLPDPRLAVELKAIAAYTPARRPRGVIPAAT